MAAAARKTVHKSAASNPSSRYKASAKKTNTARKTGAVARRNGRAVSTARKRTVRRNPSEITSAAILAIGGALVITGFDTAIGKFAPQLSNTVQIGSKVVVGFIVGTYGKKFLGSYAGIVQGALWLAAGLQAVNVWLKPEFPALFATPGQPLVTQQEQIKDNSTGQLGTRLFMSDGNTLDVWDNAGQMAYAN